MNFKTQWIKNNLTGLNRDLGFYSLLKGQAFSHAIIDSPELFYGDLKQIQSYFEENYTDSTIYNQCRKICEDYFRIEPGSKSPPLTLPDTNGNIIALDN